MRRSAAAGLAALAASVAAVAADEIPITPAQIETLGIVTARPEPVTDWQTTTFPATVTIPPASAFAVNTPLEGLVASLKVAFGDRVAAGQLVATVSSPVFLELQRDFLQSVNELKLADTERTRDRQMAREGIIAERRLQSTESRYNEVATRSEERRRALRLAGVVDENIDRLAKTRTLIPEVELRAPVSGTVIERLAETGQLVGRSAPIYRIADLSVLWVEINVPAEKVGDIAPGTRVSVEVAGPEGRGVDGKVILIGPVVNPQNQTVMVRAEVADGASHMRPGQFVHAHLIQKPTVPAFRVPVTALVRSAEARFVFVRTEKGFRMQPVTVAGGDEKHAIVTGGLDGTEEIAVEGAAAVKGLWMGLGGSQ